MILVYKMIEESWKDGIDSVASSILVQSFKLRHAIQNYTMQNFLTYCSVSKSTFQRYLKTLEISSYTQFKNVFFQEISLISAQIEQQKAKNKSPLSSQKKQEILQIRGQISPCQRIFLFTAPELHAIASYYLPYGLYLNPSIILWPAMEVHPARLEAWNITNQDLLIVSSLNKSAEQLKLSEQAYLQKDNRLPVLPWKSLFIGQKGLKAISRFDHYLYLNPYPSPAQRIYEFCECVETLLFT